jgi:hypothetical protein
MIPVLERTGIFARLLVLFVFLLAIGFGLAVPRLLLQRTAAPRLYVPPPTSLAIEERWGVRVTQLAVTADGGMIDFRYQVIDPNKSIALADNPQALVQLIAEDDGSEIKATLPMPHKEDQVVGGTYFVLYGNTKGAIKPGRPVTIVVGGLRLEHVIAQ